MTKLAILIPTLTARANSLRRLVGKLQSQEGAGQVDFFIDTDEGQSSTGSKRNALLAACGNHFPYICFVDDDDDVADDYLPRILAAIASGPDVVGIEGVMTRNGKFPQRFIHSIKYDHWFDDGQFPNKTYYRNPNHLNPVRRELAIAAGFPEITTGEDQEYSRRLYPLLKTEVFIDGPMYYYLAT